MFDLLIFILVFIHLSFQYFIFIYKICLPPPAIKDTKMKRHKNKKHLQCKGPVVELRDMGRADKDRDSLWLRMVESLPWNIWAASWKTNDVFQMQNE